MAYDEDLAHRIRAEVARESGLSEKKMFGGLAFLINGNMAVSASGQGGLLLHVDKADTAKLVEAPEASRMVMRGKEMDGWLRVGVDDLDDKAFRVWVKRGVSHAKALPPK